jgi:hypothetical protein
MPEEDERVSFLGENRVRPEGVPCEQVLRFCIARDGRPVFEPDGFNHRVLRLRRAVEGRADGQQKKEKDSVHRVVVCLQR